MGYTFIFSLIFVFGTAWLVRTIMRSNKSNKLPTPRKSVRQIHMRQTAALGRTIAKTQVLNDGLDDLRERVKHRFSESFYLYEMSQKEYPIIKGELIDLWQKPGTNTFKVYHKNSVSGSGYLGEFRSRTLKKLFPGDKYKLQARIKEIHEKVDKWDKTTVFFEKRLIVKKR